MGNFSREKEGQELSAGELQAAALANSVREPVLIVDQDQKIIAANQNFNSLFGFEKDEVLGLSVYSLNDHAWHLSVLKELLEEELPQKKQVQDLEVVYDLEYFGKLTCLVNATLLETGGEVFSMLTFKPQIAGHSSISQELEYLKTVRDVLMKAPAIICSLKGPTHIFEIANKKYCELIGQVDILGKPIKEVLPEIEGQGFIDILDEVFRTGEIYIGHEKPVSLESENGQVTSFLDFVYQPLKNEKDEITGIFVHAVDVTEKVLARKKIEESESELRNIMDTAPVIIWISDENNQNVYLNRKWYEFTGQTKEESFGMGWVEAVHPEDKLEAESRFVQAIKERTSYENFYRLRTAVDEYRWMFNQGSPKWDREGNFCGMVGAVVDVHEEVTKGQLVRENEHRTRSIVEEATVATAIYTGLEMKIELANEAMINLWGKDRSVIGKTLRESLPELEGQPFFQLLHDVYTSGKTYYGKEDRVDLMIDGEMQTGYFNFTYKPLRNEQGEIYGILNMAMDVTEQRLARKKIEESERRYQEIIHSSPALIATFEGPDNIIKIANDAILEAWGKGKDVIGKPFFAVLPELVEQGFEDIIAHVYESGEPFSVHEMPVDLVRYGKKETLYYNFVYYPQRDINGKITGIVDIATEVTPQAILNQKIKESESHFRQMADLMPEKVINTDVEGRVLFFNQHWLGYTGLSSEELTEKGWTSTIHPEDIAAYQEQWERALKSGENLDMEIRLKDKEGEYKWHLSRAEAIKDKTGAIKMWISTNTDIHRLKEEEKRKEDFLKVVSHELKTPVTSIKGYIQLLLAMLKSAQDKKVSALPLQPSLERIDHQVGRLTRLISEMLDISRIEENKLEMQKEIFSINELVTETVQDIKYTNTQHKIEVTHYSHCLVNADKDRIGQVLINLVTNAIKYSPESQDVEITIQEKPAGKVRVSIIDHGIGIDKENHVKIFKRFFRISEEDEDTYSGFGIGLYLTNEIIERHGGVVEVISEKGKGSEFSFILDTATQKDTEE
ncbi:PAS domain S-box-containing protein [Salinimicrobium catena]|uniref:histidine kinase n=1 Tax=Salinimicrobium catena TaxID=390640 RepID=A0A1H5P603_9FLAO|nr:PAS domain S-box protein [Salinimicrobium catena]SDL71735.1 PAS domain S-box-containing protein [Salinimicrobium catena]SEF09130.1 PAS domain S-box-containing protein [Salinimicrobium catena]